MGTRGNDLRDGQKKFILKLKSGGKIGKILGINRFTVCHVLKRKGNQEKSAYVRKNEKKGARKSKCGRKRQSNERLDRRLLNIVKVKRRRTLSDIPTL